jgi:transcriptional regulator GlxA family with amidase domain
MKQIVFLLADGLLKPSCLFNAIEVFEKANDYYASQGNPPFYTIRIAGTPLQQKLQNARLTLNAIEDIRNIEKPDLIIFPAFDTPNDFAIQNSREALDWVANQYKEGAEVASLCTGTFLLAAAGLLKNKSCSTHWKAEASFRTRFPGIHLQTDKIITDQNGVYTAGGATSSLNLILYLVEKYSGRPAALSCAKLLQIDIARNSQSPFILFEGMKDHKDETIRSAQDYIETKVEEKLTVEELAGRCAMNRINFTRRFKKATHLTPMDYIQRIKIEAAKRTLESTRKNINEVMYSVGYADPKAFRNIFRKIAGVTPQEYKNKFSVLLVP